MAFNFQNVLIYYYAAILNIQVTWSCFSEVRGQNVPQIYEKVQKFQLKDYFIWALLSQSCFNDNNSR